MSHSLHEVRGEHARPTDIRQQASEVEADEAEPNEQKDATNSHSAARQRHVWYAFTCISLETTMQIKDSVALVTGASRGIGRAFLDALLERGASRIYAAGRDLASLDAVVRLDPKRIRALKLDVTSAEDARAAAAQAKDLTLLINTAAVLATGGLSDIPV